MACKNPLEAYLVKAFNAVNNGALVFDALTSGFTGSTSVYCCNDCGQGYILAGSAKFFRYYNLMCGFDQTCCFNYRVNTTTYLDMIKNLVPIDKQCCDKFNDKYLNNLETVVGCAADDLFEYSTINGESSLDILASVLSQYDTGTAYGYYQEVLNEGVVIWCDGDNVYGSTLDLFTPTITKTAMWYDMNEHPEFIHALTCGAVPPYSSTTFTLSSLIVDGVEYITTPFTEVVNPTTVNWVPANNSILSGCTIGNPTGTTYTNYVDLLNNAFTTFGLSDFRAEVATVEFPYADNSPNGFYIIFPTDKIWSLETSSSQMGGQIFTYSNTELLVDGSPRTYWVANSELVYDCLNDVVIGPI